MTAFITRNVSRLRSWLASAPLLSLLLPLISVSAHAAPNGPPAPPTNLPAYELSLTQTANLVSNANANFIALSSLPTKMAATARADSSAPPAAAEKVARTTNAIASVYASDVISSAYNGGNAAPPYPNDASANQFFNFKETGNAAQAWAMMSAYGQPFLALWDLGKATSSAAASWRTTLIVPGTGDQQLYLQFIVPAVTVTGVNEQDGPSLWQSRFRANIMLNGYPVWSTDVMRYNELYGATEKARHLAVFGTSLGHSDGSGEASDGSSQKTVTLYLGRFAAASELDITALFSAESAVKTGCTTKNDELFCSRGTVVSKPVINRAMPSPRFITVQAPVYYPPYSQTSF